MTVPVIKHERFLKDSHIKDSKNLRTQVGGRVFPGVLCSHQEMTREGKTHTLTLVSRCLTQEIQSKREIQQSVLGWMRPVAILADAQCV